MSPKRATEYIKTFELSKGEEQCLIECLVRQKSCIEFAQEQHLSVETVKRIRKRAFTKIVYELNNDKETL
jgi:DNA-binding CsgD family transcriptional regulator